MAALTQNHSSLIYYIKFASVIAFLPFLAESDAFAAPLYCSGVHDIGRMGLYLTNGGILGNSTLGALPPPLPYPSDPTDPRLCHLGGWLSYHDLWGIGDEYPVGSGDRFLRIGGVWIGGVTEMGDTLVSIGSDGWNYNFEFFPDEPPNGSMQERSNQSDDKYNGARSEQDFTAVFTDTLVSGVPGLTADYITHRSHRPLGLEVTQISSVWSNVLLDDFCIIEYQAKNIGQRDLRDVYIGVYLDPYAVHSTPDTLADHGNDLNGFLNVYPSPIGCGFLDTLQLAWAADNSGNPNSLTWEWVESGGQKSIRSATALRLLSSPPSNGFVSYNWWISSESAEHDFGPRHRAGPNNILPNFETGGSGTPEGDRNKYHILSNGEHDYDQPLIPTIGPTDPIWHYPPPAIRQWPGWGAEIHYCLSVGPYFLPQGKTVSVVFAYVGGENFHTDPRNWLRLKSGDIDGWYARMDFSDLAKHAKQAEWVYDNPGYDTDGDGYRGKFHVCVLDSVLVDSVWVPSIAETTYYAGDGVPDWRAVGPPPAPKFWLYPYDHGIRVRFNGLLSETTKDFVSNRLDFEGYRIYLGRDDREASLAVAAGYDQKNYDKYVWNPKIYPSGGYEVQDIPFTLDQLRCFYGTGESRCTDSFFDPTAFSSANPYRMPGYLLDSLFYFQPHGYNASRLGVDTPIKKIYPDEPKPVPGQPIPPEAYTDDGYLKYYEYECVIDNLLPTVPYYVNVTAFDYGDPAGGVEALESSKMLGLQDCFALENANQTGVQDKPAYVYPNPYRTDANYRQQGYEGRGSDRIADRERRIHFANLPAKCWIRVHTLDGDLVREIRHDMDPNDPASDHDTWDLINRNIMAVESGLYYWSVEGDDGKVQIGKLVIIK